MTIPAHHTVMVPPGIAVELPAGTYSCTAYVHGYRLADKSYLGQVAAGLTLTIKN